MASIVTGTFSIARTGSVPTMIRTLSAHAKSARSSFASSLGSEGDRLVTGDPGSSIDVASPRHLVSFAMCPFTGLRG